MNSTYNTMKVTCLLLLFLGSLIAPSSAAKEPCHPDDKRALLRIKQQLLNTSTNFFDTLDLDNGSCNDWSPTIGCDSANKRVTSLYLIGPGPDTNVTTPFPSGVGDLHYLEDLTINYYNFSCPIPASLGKLRRLRSVDLRFNVLTGSIPSFFGTCQNLTQLQLSENLLTGALPPGLAELAPIEYLQLSNNRITGTIPESFGHFKTDETIRISLSNNRLSGEIPRSFDKDKFWSLEFSGNKKLKGDASFLFSKDKTAMGFLDLSDNSFSFDMTNLSVTSRLAELYLDQNKIYGSLPKALAGLPDFNFFNVSYNQLCGRIPAGALKKFNETSYLHNKCLCGHPLPHCRK